MLIHHVIGARPNFMKVAPVHAAMAGRKGIQQKVIHTGQHYDTSMSDIFFNQLGIPSPDFNLGVGSASHAKQTAEIMIRLESVFLDIRPDLVLVYGDVNSTVAAALVCSKILIPVGHVEAGLRSFDRTMPEEINRVLTDRVSDYLFTPSVDGNENLIREGIPDEKIYLVGNVMIDTLVRLSPLADATEICKTLGIIDKPYILVTLHRPSNVDDSSDLLKTLDVLDEIASKIDIVFPVHPRTRQIMQDMKEKKFSNRFHFIDPVGYVEFLGLQRNASLVITDSGGIQEETTYLGVPCITVRENTERPVTVSVGSNVLVGRDEQRLKLEAEAILDGKVKKSEIPPLWDGKAGERIADVIENAFSG
jgi:UDP-N-acetylglucosamine 2-epimerase (non-hydrolysing)